VDAGRRLFRIVQENHAGKHAVICPLCPVNHFVLEAGMAQAGRGATRAVRGAGAASGLIDGYEEKAGPRQSEKSYAHRDNGLRQNKEKEPWPLLTSV
jgi:hypothetical protein